MGIIKTDMSYKKFEKPVKTEIQMLVGYQEFSDIFILGETDKAYLIAYNKPYKRGSGISTHNEVTQWIPKSIWDADKYFDNHSNGNIIFNKPMWLK